MYVEPASVAMPVKVFVPLNATTPSLPVPKIPRTPGPASASSALFESVAPVPPRLMSSGRAGAPVICAPYQVVPPFSDSKVTTVTAAEPCWIVGALPPSQVTDDGPGCDSEPGPPEFSCLM